MPNPFFRFKQFTVYHDRCAMKVGTDGVLLGAWANVAQAHHILDIGTGTGLIALMLAQRSDALITAIDIDEGAIEQATDNAENSPWASRIRILQQDLCQYDTEQRFDAIVSNPPYFPNSLKCPDSQRSTARHTDTLDANKLLQKASELLHPEGHFSLVIPADQVSQIQQLGEESGLYLVRHTAVITRPGLPPKRALLEFRKANIACQTDELVIELDRHVYSEDYIALTREFYLKM